MREMKFRAWDTVENHFVYFQLFEGVNRYTPLIYPNAQVSPWEQFTGLRDKNGREIYEGDILSVVYDSSHIVGGSRDPWIAIVEYDTVNPCCCMRRVPGRSSCDYEYDFVKCGMMTLEVIGNIHENPELLNG